MVVASMIRVRRSITASMFSAGVPPTASRKADLRSAESLSRVTVSADLIELRSFPNRIGRLHAGHHGRFYAAKVEPRVDPVAANIQVIEARVVGLETVLVGTRYG